MTSSNCCTVAKVSRLQQSGFHWRAAWRRGEKRHAIGAGMSDGIGFGANARTARSPVGWLRCRVLARRWVPILHLYGHGGAGRFGADLYRQPVRNRRFGMMLGQGMGVQSAQGKMVKWGEATAIRKKAAKRRSPRR